MAGSSRPRRSTADRDARLDALHAQLTARVEAMVTDPGAWREWLDFASRFRGYSFNNVLMILSQRPDATGPFAGYRQWQASGRQVRRGETGLTILAPMTRRPEPTREDPAPSEASAPEPVGSDAPARESRRLVGFRPVTVFDVGQTDGPPVPEQPRPALLAGQAPPGLWDMLAAQVAAAGFTLTRGDCDGANGVTRWWSREVRVRDDVDDAQAVKTLAHELGHVLLHAPDGAEPGDTRGCRGVREVEAESVAHLVLAARGMDTAAYTHDYVTGWATDVPGTDPAQVVRSTADRVIRTASLVLDRCDRLEAAEPSLTAAPAPADAAGVGSAADRPPAQPASARFWAITATSPRPDAPITPEQVRRLLNLATTWYLSNASSSWVPRYLAGRGLSAALESPFRAGYAPPGWTTTTDMLRRKGWSDADLLAAGVGMRTRDGRVVDRFRDRLMLPVREGESAHVIGFVSRANPTADPAATPRYLNSPASATYDKSQALFGLWENADALRAGARPVLVEGPLDAVAVRAATAGAAVGIAACGTALTADHVDAVMRLAVTAPLVMFDGDAAGRGAAARLAASDHPRLSGAQWVPTPDGGDPADLPHPLLNQLVTAPLTWRPLPAAQVDHALSSVSTDDTLEVRVAVARAVAPAIWRYGDPDAALRATAAIAHRLDLAPATVQQLVIAALHAPAPVVAAPPAAADPALQQNVAGERVSLGEDDAGRYWETADGWRAYGREWGDTGTTRYAIVQPPPADAPDPGLSARHVADAAGLVNAVTRVRELRGGHAPGATLPFQPDPLAAPVRHGAAVPVSGPGYSGYGTAEPLPEPPGPLPSDSPALD